MEAGFVGQRNAIWVILAIVLITTIYGKPTKRPLTTIESTTENAPTTPLGCLYEEEWYNIGDVIYEGYDESSKWCYGRYCGHGGRTIPWDNFNCVPTTIPQTKEPSIIKTTPKIPTPGTTVPTTSGCIPTEGYDEFSDHCYGTYCDENGHTVAWDTWNCKRSTTSPEDTTPPITPPDTTRPPPSGCFKDGKYYQPGQKISDGYDDKSNKCYGTYCKEGGEIIKWDKWDCKQTTMPPTPIFSTTAYTTISEGCFYQGSYYALGQKIEEGYDKNSNWCYGALCDEYGNVQQWDNFNCMTTPQTTVEDTTIPTTLPQTSPPITTPGGKGTTEGTPAPTTLPLNPTPPTTSDTTTYQTTPPGCFYEGKYYMPGEEIEDGYDKSSNWCYGSYCDEETHEVVSWDNFHCMTTAQTTEQTTTTEHTTVPFSTIPSTKAIKTTPKRFTKTTKKRTTSNLTGRRTTSKHSRK